MIIAVDTETGGLDPAHDPILSIAAVKLDQDMSVDFGGMIEIFVSPPDGYVVSEEVRGINGYSEESWKQKGAVSLQQAMTRLASWLPSRPQPLAHNAGFDKSFMEKAEKVTGVKLYWGYRWHDSMATFMAVNMAFRLGHSRMNLESLARACGHWGPDFKRTTHGALEDALACAAGYRWLIDKIRSGQPAPAPAPGAPL